MFRKIKNRIVRGRSLKPLPTAKVIQEHEDRLTALEQGTPLVRNIKFTVTDGTDPVEGATVRIGDVSKTTGSAGGCTFNDVSDGEIVVSVTADGYQEYTKTFVVSEENTEFDITLQADS